MARTLGVQSRKNWQVTTRRHSEHVEPSRPMQSDIQVKKMSDGLRMSFIILRTAPTDVLECTSGCTARTGTAHTACLRLSDCTRSSCLCGKPCKPCVMSMIIWNPLTCSWTLVQFLLITAALKNCAAEFWFPKGRDAAAAFKSAFVSPAAVRLGHGP